MSTLAAQVAGDRTEKARQVALVRKPGTEGGLSAPAVRGAHTPMERDDTWEHIRFRMTLVPVRRDVSSLSEFRRKLRRYHGNQRFFDTIGEKARPWLYHIERQLAERGMPGELALLPAVESGYDPRAFSSWNAAGLWQIVPGTARDLKLERSWWYDARYDTVAATSAALDYLTHLRELFNNDWLLAVAAYNCGPGNVRRAIRRAGLEIDTASYAAIERHLPRETRGHITRWLVLSEIVAMPRLHNVRMKAIPWRAYFTEVSVESQIDLAVTARRAGVPPVEFSRLNLGFRRGMTGPKGPHRLLVPAEYAARLGQRLGQMRPAQFAGQERYRIRAGDTLTSIALAHDTTVEALMTANRLDSHLILAGRKLMIPVPRRPTPETRTASAKQGGKGVHIVSVGESLWFIARQYGTTVRSLRNWNHLAPDTNLLRPGQHLRIRGEG